MTSYNITAHPTAEHACTFAWSVESNGNTWGSSSDNARDCFGKSAPTYMVHNGTVSRSATRLITVGCIVDEIGVCNLETRSVFLLFLRGAQGDFVFVDAAVAVLLVETRLWMLAQLRWS